MLIIGITGKSGSGKTSFASLLARQLTCNHINIDEIGHQALLQPEILKELCDKFGNTILEKDGNIDRKKIGDIVFTKRHKMRELSDLTWNFMKRKLDELLIQDCNIVILEWILLPHTKYWNMCNYKILVEANDAERKQRVIGRDNISEEYFTKRDSASIDYSSYKFDFIFANNYQSQTMNQAIQRVLECLMGE